MKNLHIMHNDKFNKTYIEFINKEFGLKEHVFLFIRGFESEKIEIPKFENVEIGIEDGNKIKKLLNWFILFQKKVYKSKKIYLHGLFNPAVIFFLFLQPWLLKKCNWIIWGGDLYSYQTSKLTLKSKFYEFMRAFCTKRFGGLITYLKGDYELAQEWYGAKGKYLECIMYPSNLYKEFDILKVKKDEDKIYIQIGNSADPSNNHIEILDKLKQYKGKNIEIICPISYGDKNHAQKVKAYGKKIFGENFIPLTEFLSFDKYLEILGKVDIAIFNHKRQQAMGNIITLLGLGKKVYIRSDIVTWSLFETLDIKIWDSMKELSLKKISLEKAEENNNIIKERFSEKRLKKELERIFEN